MNYCFSTLVFMLNMADNMTLLTCRWCVMAITAYIVPVLPVDVASAQLLSDFG